MQETDGCKHCTNATVYGNVNLGRIDGVGAEEDIRTDEG
jgi:hypothetical protein